MRERLSIRLLGGLLISASLLPGPAQAAADANDSSIVVTARRTQEKSLDVPLSVTAIAADQIAAGSIDGMQSLASQVPGLFFETTWGGGNSFLMLRGQNQPSLFGDNVGVFVDGVYQANRDAINIEPLDLERIEVVKGPQSALFGRSTFAGLLNYVPAQPSERWEASASADAGTDGYFGARAALSLPLSSQLKARVAAGWRKADGTWDNAASPGQHLGNFRKLAVAGTISTRDGSGPLSARLSGRYGQGRSNQPPFTRLDYRDYNCGSRDTISGAWSYFCGEGPIPRQLSLSPELPDSRTRGGQIALHLALDLGWAELRSDTSFYKAVVDEYRDIDASADGQLYGVCRVGFNCSVLTGQNLSVLRIVSVNSLQLRRIASREYGQELRLAGAAEKSLHWQVGAAAFWSRNRTTTSVGGERGALAPNERLTSLVFSDPLRVGVIAAMNNALVEDPNGDQVVQNDSIEKRRTLALFGTADWRATGHLGLRVEVRGNWERMELDNRVSQFLPSFGSSLGPRSFFTVTPRFGIDFRPKPNWLVFASYARGSRSGGINAVANLIPEEQTYEPESNWTAEVGVKYAGHGLLRSFEATAYHIDWRNIQILGLSSSPGVTALVVRNTQGIENWGVELSGRLQPLDWLGLDGAFNYTHPRFKDGSEDPGSTGFCGIAGTVTTSSFCRIRPSLANPARLVPDISGNVPNRTVEVSWTAGATIAPKTAAFRGMKLHLGLSYQSNLNDRQTGGLYYGEHMLLDARLSIPIGPVSLEVWGTNLTNSRYIRLSAGSGGPLFFINQPRPSDLLLSEGRRLGVTLRFPD